MGSVSSTLGTWLAGSAAALVLGMSVHASAPATMNDAVLREEQSYFVSSSAAPVSVQLPAPRAAVRFCRDNPEECAPVTPTRVRLDAAAMSALWHVNTLVNASIQPRAEVAGQDAWLLGQREGDCDDYAVQKRHELRRLGFPASALLLAAGYLPDGEAHLVLVVATDQGDYVLDNLGHEILPWDLVPLRWISRQSAHDPRHWQAMMRKPVQPVTRLVTATTQVSIARAYDTASVQGPVFLP